jgi:hypothetical protein
LAETLFSLSLSTVNTQLNKMPIGHTKGRKPYGSGPGEKETIAHMHMLRQKGVSYEAIAELLNKAGNMPRTTQRAGKTTKWHGAAVQRIIKRGTPEDGGKLTTSRSKKAP